MTVRSRFAEFWRYVRSRGLRHTFRQLWEKYKYLFAFQTWVIFRNDPNRPLPENCTDGIVFRPFAPSDAILLRISRLSSQPSFLLRCRWTSAGAPRDTPGRERTESLNLRGQLMRGLDQ